MPKIVNHAARREELGEAAWRVIRREGLEAVSVRNVAREAGMSMGSLRHYFESQSELMAFAMRMVVERITARLEALESDGNSRRYVEAVIGELLPLDEKKRAESEVWLSFTGRALVDPALRELSDEVYDALHALMRRLVEALVQYGQAAPELDIELEAERLQALIDGLLIHGVARPKRVSREYIEIVIERHLDSLLPLPRA